MYKENVLHFVSIIYRSSLIFILCVYSKISLGLIIPMTTGQMEALTIYNVDSTFQTITLEQSYNYPVIVCTHEVVSTADPAVAIRIDNVMGGSFDVSVQIAFGTLTPVPTTVHCLVAEQGDNELADGTRFEARTVDSNSTNRRNSWNSALMEDVSTSGLVTGTYTDPVLLGQVMSYNDTDFSVFWNRNCAGGGSAAGRRTEWNGTGNLCVGKQTGFDTGGDTRADETLGFFVIEGGSGSGDPADLECIAHEYAFGADTIGGTGNSGNSYTLSDTYIHGVSTQNAEDGGDGSWSVLFGTDPFAGNQLNLADEETDTTNGTTNNGRGHTTEPHSYWVFRTVDYGDAPDSYLTTDGVGGAEHLLESEFVTGSAADIFIGSAVDHECDATVDPMAATDTDDGGVLFPFSAPDFSAGDSYTVMVPYTGDAELCGWIDFDYNGQTGDGIFENDERVCIQTSTCPGGGVSGTCSLTFTAPADFIHNDISDTYARFRIGPIASEVQSPNGLAHGGEVEDYVIEADTLPVSLSSFSSKHIGNKLDVDWGTSSELFNVGFQLWGLDGVDQKWEKLHNWLVRSGSGNAVEPQSYAKRARVPASIEQLVSVGISSVDSDGAEHYYGPFNLGQSYGDLGDLQPIAWDAVRAELDARMASAGYVKDRVNGYRKVSVDTAAARASGVSTDSVVEFSVSADGLYRITAAELTASGIDWSDELKRDVAVIDAAGDPVVRYVKGGRTLGTSGEIYFYAKAPDETAGLYTDAQSYRLVLDRYRALNAPVQRESGVSSGFSASYTETSVVENDNQYIVNSAADDPWLDKVVVAQSGQVILHGIRVPIADDAQLSQSMRLHLGLGKSSDLAGVGDEHVVRGVVLSPSAANGVLYLDTQTSNNSGLWNVEFEIPADTPLRLDGNGHPTVGGAFSAGPGYELSEVHIDSIGLSYARAYTAKSGDNHLAFSAPNAGELGYEVVVPDNGYPWVFASDGGNLVRVLPESAPRGRDADGNKIRTVQFATLSGSDLSAEGLQYWVGARTQAASVDGLSHREIVSQDSVVAQAQGSNYLLIAHPSFMGASLDSYAAHKQSQGYTVSIINYLDVVDAYGGGQSGPAGLTAYLSALDAQGSGIDHVLLVGGSTYDHTGNGSSGAITFIPGHYGQSSYSHYTVSDAPYVMDAEGEPFASIGRWPVRSMDDLQVIVDKSMLWASTDHSSGEALLIAENTIDGENLDFAAALDGVAQHLPAGYSQRRVYVDKIMTDDPSLSVTQALSQAKGEIIGQLNNTPDVVLYNGHASTRALSNKNLFKSGDISQVSASGAEVWLPMSCYVTYYESTHVNTLAHQLLFSGNAVAITGAVLLSYQDENLQMGSSILNDTMTNGSTLGGAVNQAKQAQNNPKLDINWSLLGDPTSQF